MGYEQHSLADGKAASAASESPFHMQLVAEQEPAKQKEVPPREEVVKHESARPAGVQPETARQEELKPEGRGGSIGGRPTGGPGGGFPRPEPHPPQSPGRGGEGGGRNGGGREGGGREGGGREGGGRGDGDGRKPPEWPPQKPKPPEGPPHRPEPPGHNPPPGGWPPGHRPDPHPPRPEPHPGDPDHGFHHGRPWGPPPGDRWGWEDHNRWRLGWDPWFFQRDPNWVIWENNIESEADFIAGMLDSGNATAAANELNEDLFRMRGDIYAQDHLLNRIDQLETKGVGADLNLGQWDPVRGTWDNITVIPDPADPVTPVQVVSPYDAFGNPI